MAYNADNFNDIDAIISSAFREETLRELFEKRIHEMGIPQTQAQSLLGIERRTLNGILDGTQKRTDYRNLYKLAIFLRMPSDQIVQMHIDMVEKNFAEEDTDVNKRKFIRENFDLAELKKSGFIDSVMNFQNIEQR